MRKLILTISTLIVSALCLKAQCNLSYKSLSDFKNDTSAFVMYNFMDRADCYIGKTFSDVIADLNIPVKNFAYRRFGLDMMGIDITVFPNIFHGNENRDFNSINVKWEKSLSREEEYPIIQGKDGWNQQMYEHYKNMKIKSVYVYIPTRVSKLSKYYEKYKTIVDEYEKKDMARRYFFNKGELIIRRPLRK